MFYEHVFSDQLLTLSCWNLQRLQMFSDTNIVHRDISQCVIHQPSITSCAKARLGRRPQNAQICTPDAFHRDEDCGSPAKALTRPQVLGIHSYHLQSGASRFGARVTYSRPDHSLSYLYKCCGDDGHEELRDEKPHV